MFNIIGRNIIWFMGSCWLPRYTIHPRYFTSIRDSKALSNAKRRQSRPSVKRSPREKSTQRKIEVKDVNGI